MRSLLLLLTSVLLAQSDAKFSVHGRVTDDINHTGVARAEVTLAGAGRSLIARTNDRGEYDFSNLLSAWYQIKVDKPGFLAGSYGDAFDIGGAAKTELGDVTLAAERTISGTVRWADEEPVSLPLAGVVAVSVKGGVNGPEYRVAGGGQPNDHGEFRITGLRAGRYILYAQIAGQGGTSRMRARSVASDLKPRVVPPVVYPSLTTSIDLRSSVEFSGVSFVFKEEAGVDIDGMIQPSAADPAGTDMNVSLSSVPALPDMQSFIWGSGSGKAGEPFQFHDIPPGNYLLLTHIGTNHRGAQPLSVGTAPMHLDVVAPELAPIRGHVETQALDGSLSPTSLQISATCSDLGLYGRPSTKGSDINGDFSVTDTAPGEEYVIMVAAPFDSYVARITQDQRVFTGTTASVIAGGGAVRILLKKDGGKITGRVVDRDGKPTRAFVVLAPKNRKAADWYRTANSLRDGTFQLSTIAPGDYDLFALEQNEDDSYFDDTYLHKFKSTAVSIAPSTLVSYQVEIAK